MRERIKTQFVLVRREGGSRVVALTPFIPPDFHMVHVVLVKRVPGKSVTLRLEKARQVVA